MSASGSDRGRGHEHDCREHDCAEALTASDVMTDNVLVVGSDDDIVLAWEVMSQAGVHHLPVVDNGRLIGLLDERQLTREWPVGFPGRARRRVRNAVIEPPIRVHPDQALRSVAAIMFTGGLDAVCVADDDGRLVGIITTADIVAAVAGSRKIATEQGHRVTPALFRLVPVSLD